MKIQIETPSLVVFESELWRTTVSLIIGENYILLVDPNWLEVDLNFIKNYIEGIKKDKTCYLLFTHSDYDHIVGYGKFKNFKTIASENFVNNPDKSTTLQPAKDFDDRYYISRPYALEYPHIDIIISGNETKLDLGEHTFYFYQAVGHNKDGIIAYNRELKILIVGDYLSNVEFPYIYESVKRYQQTIDLLEYLIETKKPAFLIPGHRDYTDSILEMKNRIKESRNYLANLVAHGMKNDLAFFENWLNKYNSPKIMTEFHLGNVACLQKELGSE